MVVIAPRPEGIHRIEQDGQYRRHVGQLHYDAFFWRVAGDLAQTLLEPVHGHHDSKGIELALKAIFK
jgi:hypothetical protein